MKILKQTRTYRSPSADIEYSFTDADKETSKENLGNYVYKYVANYVTMTGHCVRR